MFSSKAMRFFVIVLLSMFLCQSCGLFKPKTVLEKRKIEKEKRKKKGGDSGCPTYDCG